MKCKNLTSRIKHFDPETNYILLCESHANLFYQAVVVKKEENIEENIEKW